MVILLLQIRGKYLIRLFWIKHEGGIIMCTCNCLDQTKCDEKCKCKEKKNMKEVFDKINKSQK